MYISPPFVLKHMIGILKTLRDNEEHVMENILLSGSFLWEGELLCLLISIQLFIKGRKQPAKQIDVEIRCQVIKSNRLPHDFE